MEKEEDRGGGEAGDFTLKATDASVADTSPASWLFRGALNQDFLLQVWEFSARKNHAIKAHFCCQIGARQRFVRCDHKIEHIGCSRRETLFLFAAANYPLRGLANHLSLFVEQEHDGSRGFNSFAKPILHNQMHNGFLGSHFRSRNCNGELRAGQKRKEEHEDGNSNFHTFCFHFRSSLAAARGRRPALPGQPPAPGESFGTSASWDYSIAQLTGDSRILWPKGIRVLR